MTKKVQEATQKDTVVAVESALTKSEQFIEKNQKTITIVVIAIIAIIGLFVAYKKLYKDPLDKEAMAQMFMAERYFEQDSFRLALKGDANYPGFENISDEYSSSPAGNLANYYAGICNLRLGNFDDAISYLESYSTKDKMIAPISKGALGDAYMEKGEIDKAIKYYNQAANDYANSFTAPIFLFKLGQALESKEDWKSALSAYTQIKEKYSDSDESRLIDKYISRAKIKLGQL